MRIIENTSIEISSFFLEYFLDEKKPPELYCVEDLPH